MEVFDYRAEIFADKAGYYVYLPATFIYGFDASKFPDQVDEKTGSGFTLDHEKNKIRTKYTCGIALLASPFFITNHWYQKAIGEPATGFTKSYFKSVNYAAVFYLLIGLIFLFHYLKNFYKPIHIFIGLAMLFLTTHLFYYSLVDTFMSHIYTFSMFSIYLWAFHKYTQHWQRKCLILLAVLVGLIILIRPINVLFLVLTLFLNVDSKASLVNRLTLLFKPLNFLIVGGIMCLVFLPQLMYFKYISGSFIYYSYTNESFTNLGSPKIIEVLFSPMNGLLIYTPIFLFFILGMFILIRRKNINGYISLISILLMIYISASWWIWSWGCSYSSRPMVDILPILSIPLVAFIQWLFELKWLVKGFFIIVISYFGYLNVELSNAYSHCFMGTEWDWKEYNKMMRMSNIFPFFTTTYRSILDKEEMEYTKLVNEKGEVLKVGDFNKLQLVDSKIKNYHMDEFGMVQLDDDKVAFKASNEKYVASDLLNLGTCIADRDEIGNWEKFEIKKMNNSDYFVLINAFGNYLKLDSLNYLYATDTSIKDAVKFKFHSLK